MTSTNTDILGERTALEETIASYEQQIDIRCDGEDDGSCWDGDPLDAVDHGITIGQARTRVVLLGNILAKYRMLEQAAEQYKNQTEVSVKDYSRMDASVRMILSARDLMLNVIHLAPHDNAILKAARLILDLAVEELDRND